MAIGQGLALQQFHRVPGAQRADTVVDDLDDAGMPYPCQRGDFQAPACEQTRGGESHRLKSDRSVVLTMLRDIDGAHPPSAEGSQNEIRTYLFDAHGPPSAKLLSTASLACPQARER